MLIALKLIYISNVIMTPSWETSQIYVISTWNSIQTKLARGKKQRQIMKEIYIILNGYNEL
jgi:hypothetical protein